MGKRIFGALQAAIKFGEDVERDLTGMGHKKALPQKAKGFIIRKWTLVIESPHSLYDPSP